MVKKITREELIDIRIKEQVETTAFYQIKALNYTGVCTDGTSYSEVIAEWLCNEVSHHNEQELRDFLLKGSNMKKEKEKKEYLNGPIHDREKLKYNTKSNRNEEKIAMRLFQMDHLDIEDAPAFSEMRVVDYQVPVNRVFGSSEGKVDLVFSNQERIMIGELKDEDSHETLLRAVVEAKTYQYKIQSCDSSLKRFTSCYAPESKEPLNWIQPAVLLFSGAKSQPWIDYEEMTKKDESWLRHLIALWDMAIYVVVPEGNTEEKPYQERDYFMTRIM